ncbi:MAG: TadE/TadG family type IV pilus assembly protein [Candidatus Sericytochromatia bacterium]|nr:TadE/TadG family type IV pilus assembly protein [Candidatus Sericytochromatia bacterium]
MRVPDRRLRGQAIVEVALALPILLILIHAVLGVGQVHAAGLALVHASREGARSLAVGRGATVTQGEVRRHLAPLDPSGQTRIAFEGDRAEAGALVRVTLSWDYPSPWRGPGLPEFLPLQASATMRHE